MATDATATRAATREPMAQLYARIPSRLHDLLKVEAAEERRSPSAQLEVILDAHFTPNEETPAALSRPGV